MSAYGKLPIRFEPNVGQVSPSVRYLAQGGGYSVGLTEQGALLSLATGGAGKPAKAGPQVHAAAAPVEQTLLRLSLVRAKAHPRLAAERRQGSVSNYFIGKDPSKWRRNVANYGAVRYQQVYPGIDWVVYGNPQQFEYDLVVAPQADPGRIKLSIEGADSLKLDRNGDLLLRVKDRTLRQLKPVVYQTSAKGERRNIEGSYLLDHGQVAFALGDYDHRRTLTIDPALVYVYDYSTYLGGSGVDQAAAITVDSAGNAYVVGVTQSTNFPTASPYQGSIAGGNNAFISKLNPAGSALLYSTYLGGSGGGNNANGVAVDNAGNAYVAGFTGSSSFPTTSNVPQPNTPSEVGAAFVTKLNTAGNALVYSTYLGGSGGEFIGDQANAIAVDADGEAYVAGVTNSDDFPATDGAYQQMNNNVQNTDGGEIIGNQAFVAKYNAAGSALVYASYLGGSGQAVAYAVAVDGSGNAYLTGYTLANNFPTTDGAYSGQPDFANLYYYAFVTKFNPAGSALVYSTYLGGTSGNVAYGIALDGAGDAYVAGNTQSSSFPTTDGAYQGMTGGGDDGDSDAFVTEFNPSGSSLLYSTYLGGSGDDTANAIALDSAGNIYVAGTTNSGNFPVTSNALQSENGTDGDSTAFVTVLAAGGAALNYSSYLGGNQSESGYAIAVDSAGGIYVAGQTNSDNFPVTANPVQGSYGGSGDAFVTKIALASAAPTVNISASAGTITLGQSTTLTWTSSNATSCSASGSGAIGSAWSGMQSLNNSEGATETPTAVGTATYTLTCTGSGGSISASATVTVNAATVITPPPPPSGGPVSGSAGGFGPGVLSILGAFAALRRRRRASLLAMLCGTALLSLALLPAPAHAQLTFDTQHAYLGIKLGEGLYVQNSGELGAKLAAQGQSVSGVSLRQHQIAGGIYGGVPFWSALSLEASVVDLGKYDADLNSAGNSGQAANALAHSLRPAGQGFTFGLGGLMPLFAGVYLRPHAGVLVYDSTQKAESASGDFKVHRTGVGGAFGLSALFSFTDNLSAGVGFDAYVEGGGGTVNLPSAQLEYRFAR